MSENERIAVIRRRNNLEVLNPSKVNVDRQARGGSIARVRIEGIHKVWIVDTFFL